MRGGKAAGLLSFLGYLRVLRPAPVGAFSISYSVKTAVLRINEAIL